MDIVDKIIRYEDGQMDLDEVVEFFKELLRTGLIYQLQGSYQRQMQHFIDEGLIGHIDSRQPS